VYALACVLPYRLRARGSAMEDALAALVVAATALAALAIPMDLRREWLAVAWALQALALAFLAGWLSLPVLATLAAILGALGSASGRWPRCSCRPRPPGTAAPCCSTRRAP